MTITEAIRRLNLIIEPKQDANNEAIKMAVSALREKVEKQKQ